MLVLLEERHHFFSIHLLRLIERCKLDLFRGQRLIRERALDCVEVMGTYGNKRPLASKVLMKFVLQRYERVVEGLIKLDIPQNSTRNVRSNLGSLRRR